MENIMVNEQKVALMTKLALYEEKEGKKNIPLGKYYKDDYVSMNVVATFIWSTFAYMLILGAIVFMHLEQMMVELATMDYVKVGTQIAVGYVAMLVVNVVIAYIVYTIKFKRVRVSLNEYNANLKKLYIMYNESEEE